jgi:signal transduction histidine kinase
VDATVAAPAPRAGLSPTRQFAWLTLLTVGASTLVFGATLGYFAERGILDREWASTSALVQAAARFHLRPGDLAPRPPGAPPSEADDRFEELTRQVRMLPDVQRLTFYDGHGGLLWADTERRLPLDAPAAPLAEALGGETAVSLQPAQQSAAERVDLYVPIRFPGEGRVAGVVLAQVDAGRVLATVRRARIVLWSLAALSGLLLYGALYGIVWRAARRLQAQHAALGRRAEELARANAELRAVQQQLVTAERLAAFGEITAAVAHGLGNPLAAIRGLTQVALMDVPAGPLRERLTQVVAETDRLTERMRGLLRYGRPVEQRRVPTALDAAVGAVLDGIRARCEARGVTLDVAVPADLPKVRLDPACFDEALLCLLNNALEAMPDGGHLRVAAAPTGGALDLVVQDSGPGIPPATLARIFEPFFTTRPSGTGLGLAIARKLLEGAGGRLVLTSEPGRGTRATITLPTGDA